MTYPGDHSRDLAASCCFTRQLEHMTLVLFLRHVISAERGGKITKLFKVFFGEVKCNFIDNVMLFLLQFVFLLALQ